MFAQASFEVDRGNIRQFVAHPCFDEATFRHHDPRFPKISVVMPSFRQVEFIERSILSVLNQNYPNVELIVIDGGSDDGTVDLIKKYERFISYWVSEPDRGQSNALDKGFSRATGTILGWLNSDDLYLPHAFESVVQAFARQKRKKVVHGDFLTIDTEDRVLTKEYAFDFSLRQFKYEGFHLNAQAMFWRKEVHDDFCGFDDRLFNTMDYEMILAFGINEGQRSFFRIPVPLGCFRRHSAQKTKDTFRQRVLDEHLLIARKHGFLMKYGPWGHAIRYIYRCRRAYWYVKRGGPSYALAKYLRRPVAMTKRAA